MDSHRKTATRGMSQERDGCTWVVALEQAGYVSVEKVFVSKKPRTRISVTRAGRKAFRQHVAYLRDLIELGGLT
jgi:hypothetical protein